ncbi:hypothetical protein IDJ77_09570 [Mucilaginibacter sp. ZT4R22]|uniref:Uncharacterized protein n=1 Tax=Mucilaginibacter pankratovii TaxID=2772110 RepID=A0ABR7WPD3_9SPHI|nr:hypothetical protein [Mucilaginibacter pankratovii]MBD1364056.1 hypothetical protein [Mucilaginibacter pankratovii]
MEEERAERNFQCLHTNRYSAKERRSFFPFANAGKIKLISFEYTEPHDPIIYGSEGKIISGSQVDSDTVAVIAALAPNRFAVNYRKIKEEKTLSGGGIDSLTDILYNVGYTPVKGTFYRIEKEMSCYEPRNAILFLDSAGNITQYIKFCFQCWKYYYSSSKTKPVEYCEQKYDMLRTFFIKRGVKYGAETTED